MQQRYLARLTLDELDLMGYSMAGEETVVAAPAFNVCFDIGRAPQEVVNIDTVLLTHGHMDHAAGIAYYLSQRNFLGCAAGTVVVPKPLVGPIRRLMEVWAEIEGHPSPANIVGLEPAQTHELRRNLFVRAFPVAHGAAVLGYAVVEKRHKLKPEFAAHSGRELADLKRRGVQIEDQIEVPTLAYCGDTALGGYLNLPFVSQAKAVILECTFFEPDHVPRARAGRHLHAQDMPEVMKRIASPHVVLIHLSRRTSMSMARRTLKDLLSREDYGRISFLMDRRNFIDRHDLRPGKAEQPATKPPEPDARPGPAPARQPEEKTS